MKRIIYIPLFATLLFSFVACNNKSSEVSEVAEGSESSEHSESSEMTDVTLSAAQVKSLKVTAGALPHHAFEGLVEANGSLAVMPQSEAQVSPYIGANVQRIVVKEGENVKRGQVLAYLTTPDLLDLQSRYLTAYNRLSYVSLEYARQKKLYSEKIGAGKDFQQVKSEYQTLQAEIRTTASQLRLIGINPSAVQNGKTFTSIAVHAPICGTIEDISVKTGQYADVSTPMFRIVNTDHIYADLLVFEKDVPKVKVGQKVSLSLKSSLGCEHTGKVYSVGKIFEENPKAVHVRVSIDGNHSGLVTGMYLCGKIASDTASLLAIPEEGVVDNEGKSYIFTAKSNKDSWNFHPVEVKKGRTEGGFVEISLVDQQKGETLWALDNAYYLISEMKKAETGEDD